MWRHEDLFFAFGGGNPYGEPRAHAWRGRRGSRSPRTAMTMMAAAPLMHGAAQMAHVHHLVRWAARSSYVRRVRRGRRRCAPIEREKVLTLSITGDAMARPLADEIATGARTTCPRCSC